MKKIITIGLMLAIAAACALPAKADEGTALEQLKQIANLDTADSVPAVQGEAAPMSYCGDNDNDKDSPTERINACGKATHLSASYETCVEASRQPAITVGVIQACGDATTLSASFECCLTMAAKGVSVEQIKICGKTTSLSASFEYCLDSSLSMKR